jgi:hypothetical protein
MDRSEVLKVDAVLDELEQVHLDQPGIVLSPPQESPLIDRHEAFQAIRWLGRRARGRGCMAVIDEHQAVELFDGPRPRTVPRLWLTPVGVSDDTAVSADLPSVKRALDGIALHLAVGQVGSEVGTIGIDHLHLLGRIPEHHPSVAGALHERWSVAKVDRPPNDVPSLGVRRGIACLARGLDDRI